ncbi:hypothetical protein EV44_g0410 [Erysiphe necator]|uniref:Uncharacterized protein n=1 Tax=Uncinula necator TaxID=52586 RepID=A0A0B1PD70_UNCNE|nr:hypothetical protein EV44_g0410 [Erysiphe necator]
MVKQNDGIAIILIVFLLFMSICGIVACVLLARARANNQEDSFADTSEIVNDGVEDEAGDVGENTGEAVPEGNTQPAPPPPPPPGP